MVQVSQDGLKLREDIHVRLRNITSIGERGVVCSQNSR